jgi:hypothetical protein
MKKLYLLFLLLSISCKKDCHYQLDYFIFGKYSSFCIDDCSKLFLLKDGKIYPDSIQGLSANLQFSKVPLTSAKYTIADSLSTNFPSFMQNTPNITYGCPDCLDQGLFYVEKMENGVKKTWKIDSLIDSIPLQIRPYIQKMDSVINKL